MPILTTIPLARFRVPTRKGVGIQLSSLSGSYNAFAANLTFLLPWQDEPYACPARRQQLTPVQEGPKLAGVCAHLGATTPCWGVDGGGNDAGSLLGRIPVLCAFCINSEVNRQDVGAVEGLRHALNHYCLGHVSRLRRSFQYHLIVHLKDVSVNSRCCI